MNARLIPNSIGSTGFDFVGPWPDPTPSVVAWGKDVPKQDSAIKAREMKGHYYRDWGVDINYPDKSVIDRVTNIENQVKELTEYIENISKPEEIVIREISFAQAKKEIRQYFKQHHGKDFTAADIEDELGIDFDIASEVCEKLEKEGKIKGV